MTATIRHLHERKRSRLRRFWEYVRGVLGCAAVMAVAVLAWYGGWLMAGTVPSWGAFSMAAGICALFVAVLWLTERGQG